MEREKKLNTADKNVSTMDDLNEKCKRRLFSEFKSVQMAKYKKKKEKKKEKQAEKKVKKKSSQRKEKKATQTLAVVLGEFEVSLQTIKD